MTSDKGAFHCDTACSSRDRSVSESLDDELDGWEEISVDDCTIDEGRKTAANMKRHALLARWHVVVCVLSSRGGRGQGVLTESEKWLKSATENDELVNVLKRGKKSGKSTLDSILTNEANVEIVERSKEMVESLKVNEDVKQTVSILEDFKREEGYMRLLEEGKKLFEGDEELLLSREQFERAHVILCQLEQSETFERLKGQMKTMAVKYCDDETISQGKEIVKHVKTSETFHDLVTEGKRVIARFATGEEQDLSESVTGLVKLGGQVVKQVKASDAGSALFKKGTQTVESLAEAWKADTLQSQAADILKQNEDFIDDLKNVVLPWIRDQLLSVMLPVVTGSKETKLGCVNYELSDMQLSSLVVPVDNVTIRWEKSCLHVNITGLQAAMKSIKWQYNKPTFPQLTDDGKADAGITGGSFHVAVEIKKSVEITELASSFASLHIEMKGTRASWVYNALIYWFKNRIQNVLNEELNQMLDLQAATLSDAVNKLVRKHLPKLAAKLTAVTNGEMKEMRVERESSSDKF
ncbi:uncharacterized protein LOC134189643 [Corticium candelabrum]|uniref:uncharacterized protein LOC134189643 n=1 Tax=Corticium candelabrum TaxID=121492 RepID=UPI002E2614F9|nr:uncharacterized protein LOC134189643 [Corticium candelabrum]